MSPGVGGGRCFIIHLEDMVGASSLAALVGPSTPERLSQRRRAMASDAVSLEPDRPSSVEVLADQDAAAGIAAAAMARREVDDQAAEADGVVIGHSGLVGEGDELIALGGADFAEGRPGELWPLGEAGVETIEVNGLQPGVGGIDFGDVLQGHLSDETILEGSALALDAALPLGREGGNSFRAQFLKDPSDVSREAYAGQLFLMAPVVIVTEESAVAVLVDGRRDSVPPQDHMQEPQIADGILLGPEQSAQHDPCRVVCGMEKARGGPLGTEPEVGTAVPLHEEPDLGSSRPPAAVPGWPATPFRPDPRLAQPAADRLSPDPKMFALLQHLDEVGIVELRIDLPMQRQNPFPDFWTEGVWGRPSTAPMSQSLWAFSPIASHQTLGLAIADLHNGRPCLQRKTLPDHLFENLHPLCLMPAQGYKLLHVRLLGGDILAWQLVGTLLLGYHISLKICLTAPTVLNII
jgi:hypothetical protein